MSAPDKHLEIKQLSIALGESVLIERLDLTISSGETVCLMGASGSGKSTLLSWLSGMLDPAFVATGELWLHGRRIDGLPCEKRKVGLLFQDALLFPHLSVGENLHFAVASSVTKHKRIERAHQALERAGLEGFFDKDPATLSGGQRARVSLMRALLAEPQAILLDEPFSRLDQTLRTQFREFVSQHTAEQNLPVLLVTHDPEDIPVGSRCLNMSELGRGKSQGPSDA
ncbi:MAG: ATP-binding cassette domain-containing protein [Granulosicoccaceae bacterium]